MMGFRFCATQPERPLPQRNAQRREQTVVVPAHQLGNQFLSALYIDGDGVVGHQPPELHREHRQGLAQAERSAQVLAQFEQGLRFLPRRRDRRKECGFLAGSVLDRDVFEARRRRSPGFHFHFGRERRHRLAPVGGFHQLFQLAIAPLQNAHHFRDQTTFPTPPTDASLLLPAARPAGIDGRRPWRRENPRKKGCALPPEFLRPSARRDSPIHPIFRGGRARSAPPDKESGPAPGSPPRPGGGSSSFQILPESAGPASR